MNSDIPVLSPLILDRCIISICISSSSVSRKNLPPLRYFPNFLPSDTPIINLIVSHFLIYHQQAKFPFPICATCRSIFHDRHLLLNGVRVPLGELPPLSRCSFLGLLRCLGEINYVFSIFFFSHRSKTSLSLLPSLSSPPFCVFLCLSNPHP